MTGSLDIGLRYRLTFKEKFPNSFGVSVVKNIVGVCRCSYRHNSATSRTLAVPVTRLDEGGRHLGAFVITSVVKLKLFLSTRTQMELIILRPPHLT